MRENENHSNTNMMMGMPQQTHTHTQVFICSKRMIDLMNSTSSKNYETVKQPTIRCCPGFGISYKKRNKVLAVGSENKHNVKDVKMV